VKGPRFLIVVVVATVAAVAYAPEAWAACSANPPRSPNAFNGTVVRLGLDDRQAFVRTDDGTLVEVDGGNVHVDAVGGEDFHFILDARYDIEPDNATAPFIVNDCTATTMIALPQHAVQPSSSTASPSSDALAPLTAVHVTSDTDPSWPLWLIGVLVAAVGLATALWVRRRRSGNPDGDLPR
jgi:hypothetical protein